MELKKGHAIFTLCSLLFAFHASADPIKDRLDSLEATIKTFQSDSLTRNEKVASALATIEQIRQDFISLQGMTDANSHLLLEQKAEIARLKLDMVNRISAIEERLEIYDQQITKAVAKVVPQAASEAEAYQKSLDLVQKSDFLTAVASFRTFLKTYPKSEFADNAQYWIGECYYAMKDFQKAIKEFQALAEKYPKSDKVPGAILKQGFSFAELNMMEEAKVFLDKTIKDHPGSDESIRAREKIDRLNQKENASQPLILDSTSNIPLAPGVKEQGSQGPKDR